MLEHVLGHVRSWRAGASAPLFVVWALHAAHAPYQLPQAAFSAAPVGVAGPKNRRVYAATIHRMDAAIGALVDALDARGMWRDALLVFTNDNGGALGSNCASNWPLRGGKTSSFDGGIRVPAVVAGGPATETLGWYGRIAEVVGMEVVGMVADGPVYGGAWLVEDAKT